MTSTSSIPSAPRSQRLKEQARSLGFDRVGIARAQDAPDYERFREWLDAGEAAGMEYMGKHAEARAHPDSILEGVRSVVMVSLVYGGNAGKDSGVFAPGGGRQTAQRSDEGDDRRGVENSAPDARSEAITAFPPRGGRWPEGPDEGATGVGGASDAEFSTPRRSPLIRPLRGHLPPRGGKAVGPERGGAEVGKIARYARGTDYHQIIRGRLELLIEWLKAEAPEATARAVVDTAPLLERGFARLAGLGWIGKNTMLIDRRLGSFTFLGAVLTDLELEPDPPHATSHCGTCTRCLDACPTDAFDGPFRLDARKCVSYWTIEHKGPIPAEPAENLDGWAFGCDVCQDVCPWNRKAPPGLLPELAPRPEWESPDLIEWLTRSKGDWKRALRGSAMSRAGRVGLLRNAALLLGSAGRVDAIPALVARRDDPDEHHTVREAAAWALGKLVGGEPEREPAAPEEGAAG